MCPKKSYLVELSEVPLCFDVGMKRLLMFSHHSMVWNEVGRDNFYKLALGTPIMT